MLFPNATHPLMQAQPAYSLFYLFLIYFFSYILENFMIPPYFEEDNLWQS